MFKYLSKGISTSLVITIIVVIAVLVGGIIAWQYSEIQKESVETSEIKISEKVNIPTTASEEGPLDTALAETIVLSVQDETADIRIEKIRDYNRYPDATYPQLEVGDEISVRVYYLAPETSGGAGMQLEQIKEGEPPSITPQPKPVVGKKYLANMSLCFTDYIGGLSCKYEGWSVALYSLQPSPPPVTPGGGTNITPPSITPPDE